MFQTPLDLPSAQAGIDLYLELLKASLGDFLYDRDAAQDWPDYTYTDLQTGKKHALTDYAELKQKGLIASQQAHTMIGMLRMNQLQVAIETVLAEQIPGDLIETGVLRGGACILMRGILKAYGCRDRQVWVADSFAGFPPEQLRQRGIADPEAFNTLAASLESVRETFRRYHLLDEQVQFLKGFFENSLQQAPLKQVAVLRLDSDFYESTLAVLEALYPRLSVGGYLIVDDYYAFADCREAVREYRKAHQITSPLQRVDPVCVYWRKAA